MDLEFEQSQKEWIFCDPQCLGFQTGRFEGWEWLNRYGLEPSRGSFTLTSAGHADCQLRPQLGCHLDHCHVDSPCGLSAWGCLDILTEWWLEFKSNIPRETDKTSVVFHDLALEVTQHHFYHSHESSRFKGRKWRLYFSVSREVKSHYKKTVEMGEIVTVIFGNCNLPQSH